MTQENQHISPSPRTVSALLAFCGFLLLSAGVFFMTRLATQHVAAPVAPAVVPAVVPPTPLGLLPPPAPAPSETTTAPGNDTAADISAAKTAEKMVDDPKPAAPTPVATVAPVPSSSGVWVIALNSGNNTPDDAGIKQIEEIAEALAADPAATLSLVGINHFRRSSKRAMAAAQGVRERLRDINPALPRRINTSTEQTAEVDALSVRATLDRGGR